MSTAKKSKGTTFNIKSDNTMTNKDTIWSHFQIYFSGQNISHNNINNNHLT